MAFPVAAAIGAGTSILGSALSFASASRQNALAKEQFNRSMNFARYQYEDMKHYNSPENQLRLMRQAGLNPALAIGQLPSSAAVGSAAPGPTASFTQPDFSGLTSAGDIVAQYQLRESQSQANLAKAADDLQNAIGKSKDNLFKDEYNKWNNYLTKMRAQMEESNLVTLLQTRDQQVEQSYWDAQLSRASAGIQLKALGVADERFNAEITKLWCDAYQAVLTGQSSVKQAAAAVMNANTSRMATSAQYGASPSDRAKYFNAVLDTLWEANQVRLSEQYKNWWSAPANAHFGPVGTFTKGGILNANRAVQRSRSHREY